jgi:hypothetical protein
VSVTFETVRRLVLALPGVEEGVSYGTPGFRVRGKFLARLWEDGETLVVKCGDIERDFRLKADPETFYVTDHYRGYPAVLVRLARVSQKDLYAVLEEAWSRQAPKRLRSVHSVSDQGALTSRRSSPMATAKQRAAARKNIKKAAKAATKKKTISKLPKSTRTALGKQGAKMAKKKRRGR